MRISDWSSDVCSSDLHGFSISIPLLEGRVQGYGREEQTHFVFCEVETDEGHVGYGLTGHFLAKSVIVALHEHVLPVVKDMDPRDLEAIHQKEIGSASCRERVCQYG